jgi:hypothetical protein
MASTARYESGNPNEPVPVALEPAVIGDGQTSVEGSGAVSIRFSPEPRLIVEVTLGAGAHFRPESDAVSLGFPSRGVLTSAGLVEV